MPSFQNPIAQQAAGRGAENGAVQYESGRQDDPSVLVDPSLAFNRPPDPDRDELVVPEFRDHPIPEVARFLWVMARRANVAPPWRVRVSPSLCATYSMRRLAIAFSPHATIVMTPDGRHPAPMVTMQPAPIPGDLSRQIPKFAIEYVHADQLGGASLAPATPVAAPGTLWVPESNRTSRTT